MKSSDYFARRAKMLTDKLLGGIGEEYRKNLNDLYAEAKHYCETEIRAFYQKIADNNGISYAEAQKLLESDELAELKWTVREYRKYGRLNSATGGLYEKQLKNASAKWHVSRLEALKMQLQTNAADKIADSLIGTVTDAVKFAYSEAYFHNAFEIQKGIGVCMTMQVIDERRIEKLLSNPWTADDKTFSARIWKDRTQLVDTIEKELTRMVATGETPDKTIKAISDRLNVSKSNAGRLVMTESAYFASEAQRDCFKELGVEKYKVVAALDGNTCPVCGAMDGKIFDIADYKPGSTAEPFHPRCRCCTSPYFEDTDNVGTRITRDVKTGEEFDLPADTTYEQWKEMQDSKYGKGTVDTERKKAYNEKADKQQFERYKNVVGDILPESFEEFRKIKYDNPDEWERLKYQFRTANRYEIDGKVSTEQVVQLDNAAWYTKQTGFDFSGLTGKEKKRVKNLSRSGNAAAMEFGGETFFTHSKFDDPDGFALKAYRGKYSTVGLSDDRLFNTLDLNDGVRRENDTEAKFLEYVARQKKADEKFEVTILSEKHICKSCQFVVKQFEEMFPNAQVNIISGKRGYNGDENGNKTWKYRKKVVDNVKTH